MSASTLRQRLALVSMPWALFNRPSIQLGSLKGYLRQQGAYTVDLYHPFLDCARRLGEQRYSQISLSAWAGEALFAPLLHPAMRDQARDLFYQTLPESSLPDPEFDQLVDILEACCDQLVDQLQKQPYLLIGFSVCFNQLLASLYLAKRVQQEHPDPPPVVFGGSSCCGAVGESLVKNYPQIDYLIDGEGESRLLALCRYLAGEDESMVQGVRTRNNPDGQGRHLPPLPLDQLPIPDYDAYLEAVRRLFPGSPFIPQLVVEFSRGCWWNKCSFCNLNLQWGRYRYKNHQRMTDEVLHLVHRHESLNFVFADNALPPKEAEPFFQEIADQRLNLDVFAEVRSVASEQQLQTFRRGGLRSVQFGVEALSTSLLEKMVKGTTAMDNVAMIKRCATCNIKLEGNIIVEFPSATEEEVAETLETLEYLLPFPPLSAATFFLGYGSPIALCPGDFKIKAILAHPHNQRLLPPEQLASLTMLVTSYRGDRGYQKKLWRPVRQKIAAWQTFHEQRKNVSVPPLSVRDGRTFLIIRQERPGAPPLQHRLRGLSRKIYLYCMQPQSIADTMAAFPQVTAKQLENFIAELGGKRLMFQKDNQLLSLAVAGDINRSFTAKG